MEESRYSIIHYEDAAGETLTLEQFARRSGCHPELVIQLVRFGVIDAARVSDDEWRFPAEQLPRIQRGLRLRRDLGINVNAMGLILDLIERIEQLEFELDQLKRLMDE